MAFASDARGRWTDLFVVALSDGNTHKVVDGETLAQRLPVSSDMPEQAVTGIKRFDWLPDGSGLSFTTWETYFPGDVPGRSKHRDDLWIALIGAEAPRMLLSPTLGGHATFSPDGRLIAVTRTDTSVEPQVGTIAVTNADGTEHRVLLVHPPIASESDWRTYQLPQWAPDGKHLLVVSPVSHREVVGHGDDLYDHYAFFDSPARLIRLSVNGDAELVADGGPGTVPWQQDYNAHWSPDGREVALLAPPHPDIALPTAEGYPAAPAQSARDARTLVITRIDGSKAVEYDEVVDGLALFEWSPSGRRFAYVALDLERFSTPEAERTEQPLKLGADQLPAQVVPDIAELRSVSWLSDSVLAVNHGGQLELLRIDESLQVSHRSTLLERAGRTTIAVSRCP